MEKDLNKFLLSINRTQDEFKKAEIEWADLLVIAEDYKKTRKKLEPIAKYLVERFHEIPKVHSVRYRIKETEHLIEKIIRKRIEEKDRTINIENYKTQVTDLIGIRALHLFKEDWEDIHKFILEEWSPYETPIAYIRKGDNTSVYEKHSCTISDDHPLGYRSVHYLIESSPGKERFIVEIQTRTIFEEGWSEIDHTVRYPTNVKDPILSQSLKSFNSLASNADEMGAFVKYLKDELKNKEEAYMAARKANEEKDKLKDKLIDELQAKIRESELKPNTLKEFEDSLNKIKESTNLKFNYPYARFKLFSEMEKDTYETLLKTLHNK